MHALFTGDTGFLPAHVALAWLNHDQASAGDPAGPRRALAAQADILEHGATLRPMSQDGSWGRTAIGWSISPAVCNG